MGEIKIFCCDILGDKALKVVLSEKFDIVIAGFVKVNLENKNYKFELIDVSRYVEKGSWEAHENNKIALDKIKLVFPDLFKYRGYNLDAAILKGMLWDNLAWGMVKSALDVFILNSRDSKSFQISYFKDPKASRQKLKALLFFAKDWVNIRLKKKPKIELQKLRKLKNKFVIAHFEGIDTSYWLRLLKNFPSNEVEFLFLPGAKQQWDSELKNKVEGFISSHLSLSRLKVDLNLFKLRLSFFPEINKIVELCSLSRSFIDDLESIIGKEVKGVLTVDFENKWESHLMNQVIQKKGGLTFNTLQGNKIGSANNANSNFNYWLVWNDSMRSMLIDKCNLKGEMLVNMDGALLEDEIRSHIFRNSIEIDETLIHKKYVISVFFSPFLVKESIELFKVLVQNLRANPTWYLVFRSHPSYNLFENAQELLTNLDFNRIFIVDKKYGGKKSLYDQLKISNLSIALGSTVAIESAYMGVPCLNYALSEDYHFIGVDNIINLEKLDSVIGKLKVYVNKKESPIVLNTESYVAKKYAKFIQEKVETLV